MAVLPRFHIGKRGRRTFWFTRPGKGFIEPAVFPAAVFLIAIVAVLACFRPALATSEYADLTGQKCSVCHISASGGGGLTGTGEAYAADPESWSPPATPRARISLFYRIVHAVILYAHIFFGIIWVGTILYVHLVLKPKYAMGGLPRSELKLAWLSMPVIGITGALLTVWRMKLSPALFSTVFGKLLLVKILMYLFMLVSATFVTLYVGPRLKALVAKRQTSGDLSDKDSYTPDELDDHDGTGGARALIAARGQVYDVSSSPLWKNGLHAGRHRAGQDLTEQLKNAPHEEDVLERYPRAGRLVIQAAGVPRVVRIFTINAYFNLVGCFIVILVLVLWRW
ncbi:MAG: CopD family protein [bacterium]|nr:MAG: CopD family protein [bacterium]